MPLINVQLVEGTYDRAERGALIRNLTESVVQVKGEAVRPHATVTSHDVRSGDWAQGGQQATTDFVLEALSR